MMFSNVIDAEDATFLRKSACFQVNVLCKAH